MNRHWTNRIFEIDLRALAIVRIATGSVLLVDLAIRAIDLKSHYIGDLLVRGDALAHFATSFSVYSLSESVVIQQGCFLLTCAAAASFALGYRCKTSAAALWLLLVSLHAQNPVVLSNGDVLAGLLLLWSLFLPMGARFSIDARHVPATGDTVHLSVAGACFLVQISLVLLTSGLGKLSSSAWVADGTAIQYALALRGTAVGRAVLALPEGVLRMLTWATLAIEVVAPLLMFAPIRQLRLAGGALGVGLMLGIAITMNVGPLPLLLAGGILAFLPVSRSAPSHGLEKSPAVRKLVPRAMVYEATVALICLWLVGVAAVHSARAIPWIASTMPVPGQAVASSLGLRQHWQMFARLQPRVVWLEVDGALVSGSIVDPRFAPLSERSQRIGRQGPRSIIEYRRLRVEESLLTPAGTSVRAAYAANICREWNAAAAEDQRLLSVTLLAASENPLSNLMDTTRKVPLGRVRCAEQ